MSVRPMVGSTPVGARPPAKPENHHAVAAGPALSKVVGLPDLPDSSWVGAGVTTCWRCRMALAKSHQWCCTMAEGLLSIAQ